MISRALPSHPACGLIEEFREALAAFLAGRLPEDVFRAQRLRLGIYAQRQAGVYMVRVKVPGGLLTAEQLQQVARLAEQYAGGRAHLTTRQDIQLHFVSLERVPAVLEQLAEVGLTTREACYNTVRNVTVCPAAGLQADEAFDVRPCAQRLAYALLGNPLTGELPRKFKIAFSGCREDCVHTAINDIGLRALLREGRRGFRMTVGGGLGPLPVEGRLLEEFVAEEELLGKVEAVLRVFNRWGNRANKHKARLKFLLRERGWDWFRESVEGEHRRILSEGGIQWPQSVPKGFGGWACGGSPPPSGPPAEEDGAAGEEYRAWLESNVRAQKQPGYRLVTVRIEQGELTVTEMRALARAAAGYGDGLIRNTPRQNVMLAWIPGGRLRVLWDELRRAGLGAAGAGEISDVTACPGSATCSLGLTKAMKLAEAVREVAAAFEEPEIRRLTIKISGCPNACAQHWVADIGFYGNARRFQGREAPYYQLVLGGGSNGAGLRLARQVHSVAGRLVPAAVRRLLEDFRSERLSGEAFGDYVRRRGLDHFRRLTRELAVPAAFDAELFRDWGDEVDFSVKLGRGECAA